MTPNGFRQLQLNFSGMGCWLTLAIGFGLMTTVGIGWLLKSLLVLIVLLVSIPILLIVGAQFWLKRNLVEGACPSCSQPLTGFQSMMPMSCPNCGVALQAKDGTFVRVAPEGTIDVDVVDVDTVGTDTAEANEATTIIDVEVLPPADS
ncbi:hypothetical protein [Leptothoe spongobia]|uniref:Uncharacterized protein n=1 Tax=Leptothoe spongobia TAU-MAC 1115 TaxID=1967444 RepID=A0A947DAV7_9CYAN|nr:hypothetical protein [Leptothoe spongobia]MBT9313818.1 hypothetical protein [Leptothoe spongobia TAU-MAC 1115]